MRLRAFNLTIAIAVTAIAINGTLTAAPAAAPAPTTTSTSTTTMPSTTTTTAVAPPPTLPPTTTTVVGPCGEHYHTAINAGWDDTTWLTLSNILYAESRCNPDAFNPDDPNGGSVGVAQINLIHLKWLEPKGITQRMLFDPFWNLVAARGVYERAVAGSGCGWRPWGKSCG